VDGGSLELALLVIEQGIVLPDEYKTTVFGGHWEKKRKKVYKDGVWREEGSGE